MTKWIRNKYVNAALKLGIIALVVWSIYRQFQGKHNLESIHQTFLEYFHTGYQWWFWLAIALVPVNWGMETRKWQLLTASFLQKNFFQQYKAILAGVAISLVTPNRVGEYGGRLLMVEAKYNLKAIIASIVGSFSQLLVLLSFGLVGSMLFFALFFDVEPLMLWVLGSLGVVFIALLLFGFLNIELVAVIAKRIPWVYRFRKYLRQLNLLKKYSARQLLVVLGWSGMRYTVYCLQYYFMLRFFHIEVSFWWGMVGISTIYFIQTSVPLPPLSGLLTRGAVALQIWGFFEGEEIAILGATFILFIINLIVPALLGLVFIVQTNIMKSLGYEEKT